MKTSNIFFAFGASIHQDFLIEYPDLWSGYTEFLMHRNETEQRQMLKYLQHLLSGKYTNGELRKIWSLTETDLFIAGTGYSWFFSEMLRLTELEVRRKKTKSDDKPQRTHHKS